MTQQEFLEAVPKYRSAWVRKVRARLQRRGKVGAGEMAQDIVQTAIAELATGKRYESIKGPSDITRRVEYRLRDFLDHDTSEDLMNIEEGDDREAHRFRHGKVTTAWVMTETEDYQRQIDVKKALAALSHRHRYVAAMVFVEGHTSEEVAAQLGVTRQMVDKVLVKVKARLRDQLADYGGGNGQA